MDEKFSQKSKRRRVQVEIDIRTHNVHQRRVLERSMNGGQATDLLTDVVCECSDRNCSGHIAITVYEHQVMRKNPRHFIVLPGHIDPEIERVVANHRKFLVVEKDLAAA